MVNFINTVNEGKLEEAVTELIIEIRAHANEYTREAPLLVGNAKKTDKGIVNKHNNEPVINHLDWTEREGATAAGSVDLNEKVLIAEEGDSEVLVSPSGWNGKYPDYEKTQIVFVHDKGGEDLDQLTFVLNFKLENCLSLFEKMGVSRADVVCADNRETIKKMVGQAIPLGYDSEINTPGKFLDLLKNVNPNDPALKIIERDLQRYLNGEDISILPSSCETYLQDLEEFIDSNAARLGDFAFQAEMSDRAEETIYKIAQYIRGLFPVITSPKEEGPSTYRDRIRLEGSSLASRRSGLITRNDNYEWRDKYRQIIGVLQQISGCAGGGSRSMRVLGGSLSALLSSSSYIKSMETDQYGSLEFECGKCNGKNRRPKGELLSNCQYCGASTSC